MEKQLEITNNDILQLRGAILVCNEMIEEEEKPKEPELVVNDLDKEKDGGQEDK